MEKKKIHYVNNQMLLTAMVEYKKDCRKAKKLSLPAPRVPEYIGECLHKIAEHLSYKPNFRYYSFREDMVGDAILNCLEYIHNFDPEKSKNPFAYFTQIMYYAFIRHLDKEKKNQVLKFRVLENNELAGVLSSKQTSDSSDYDTVWMKGLYNNLRDSAHEFDEKRRVKRMARKKASTNGLSQFEERIDG